ncbi:hypothetical protein [Endozoicomonas atrinae]|uniref:hypothetical protein n=1 Tax=Endozoicomonas atrinae TaxID=1333660 RepID=UPI003B00F958
MHVIKLMASTTSGVSCTHCNRKIQFYKDSVMTKWVMLTDFALVGALLLLGKILRVHCRPLQRIYMPVAVLAGMVGLILGPSGVDILPWGRDFASNASLLTAVLFAALGLATDLPSPRCVAQRAGSLWAFNQVATVSQWLFAAMLGLFLATFFWPGLNPGFGLILSAGFMGGMVLPLSLEIYSVIWGGQMP